MPVKCMSHLPQEMIDLVMGYVAIAQRRDHWKGFAPCLETIQHRMVQIRAEGKYMWLISERANYYSVLNDISPYTNARRPRRRGRDRYWSNSEEEEDTP